MTTIKKKFLLIKSSNLLKLVVNQNDDDHNDGKELFIDLIKLKHPKQNVTTQFCFIQNSLYEMIEYSTNDLSSVFIDDYVQSDCFTYFISKFNLVYFLINFLSNSTNVEFKSLDDLKLKLIDNICEDENDRQKLKDHLDFIQKDQIEKLFDLKENSGKIVQIKFNSSKCIEWLANKVESLRIYLDGTAKVKNEKQETGLKIKQEEADSSKSKLHAFELIAQYISSNLANKLRKELNLSSPLEDDSNTGKTQSNIKRQKQEPIIIS
jgi:hypothetical protein